MGQVSLTPVVDVADVQSHGHELVAMSNPFSEMPAGDGFVDVPTDVDMTGLDVDPEEIYQNLESAASL
jgi:hypothetical protein